MTQENEDEADEGHQQTGVKAVETAARLLVAMAARRGSSNLKDVAARANMHPAKAHRYLVSMIRAGLISKDEDAGTYGWGPLAVDVGSAAIRSNNFVHAGISTARSLSDRFEVTVALAVWGTFGPTHIVVEEANQPVITKSQVGSVLPILNSATGRAFAAFDARREVISGINAALAQQPGSSKDRDRVRREFEDLLDRIRKSGIASVEGDFHKGIIALSCPVFDYRDAMVGAITVLSHYGDFDPNPEGQVAGELKAACRDLSRVLGQAETV